MPPNRVALEETEEAVLGERRRPVRQRLGDIGREFLKQRRPAAAGPANDLVVRALPADVVVRGDRGEHRDARRGGERLRFACAVVLVDHEAADADIAAELAEILDRRADVVGVIERLEIVRADDDDLLAHVAGDRQAEAAADDVAQKVEQDEIEAPLMEPELLEQFKAVDDAASASAAPDLRAAELHGEHAVALEADVADRDLVARELLLGRGLDDGRAGAAAEQERGRVALRIAADQQNLPALLGELVGEIGEREALADSALAVDRDDLRRLGRGRRLGRFDLEMHRRVYQFFSRQKTLADTHDCALQSSTIFRQAGSSKATG